ncbi:MAG TPA: PIN domain-containing protein [Solirubrobacteraceae bacterium]|nr:PIN domain-containing protein [Solirubrobacteraceae bacterium]
MSATFRVQVTVDAELAAVLAEFGGRSRSQAVRDLAVRGAEALRAAARNERRCAISIAPSALPQAPVTRAAGARAIAASRELGGERRLPAVDYLIAAAAAERGFAVLHSDRHFEPLCRVLGIDSIPIAPRGALT